jgi:hypothetical protein
MVVPAAIDLSVPAAQATSDKQANTTKTLTSVIFLKAKLCFYGYPVIFDQYPAMMIQIARRDRGATIAITHKRGNCNQTVIVGGKTSLGGVFVHFTFDHHAYRFV